MRIYTIATIVTFLLNIQFIIGQETDTAKYISEFTGEFITVDKDDNIRIYFNCAGRISNKDCAEYYREGIMDSAYVSMIGTIKDYYINGHIALEAKVENAMLDGPATYYYINGKVRSEGKYAENIRTGIWNYFYDNGKKKQVINFVNGSPLILEYYKRSGLQLVKQGNGKYEGTFLIGRSCDGYIIKGRLAAGKMHGKWVIRSEFNRAKIADEFYDNGNFQKRRSRGETFTDGPMIDLTSFHPNENLLFTESTLRCPGINIKPLNYRDQMLHLKFYPELLDSLNTLMPVGIKNQWLIAGIKIPVNSLVHQVNIKSSIGDTGTELELYRMLKSMMHFTPSVRNGFMVDSQFCFTILFLNNKVYIPALLYYQHFQRSTPIELPDSSNVNSQ